MISELNQQNQALIVKILSSHQNSLILAELKKYTKLANMYFFKALEALEDSNKVERVKKGNETWIILKI